MNSSRWAALSCRRLGPRSDDLLIFRLELKRMQKDRSLASLGSSSAALRSLRISP